MPPFCSHSSTEIQRHCFNRALFVYLPVKRSISYKPETLVNMRGWGAYSSLQEEEEENTVELLQGLSIVSLLHTVHSELYIHTSISVHSRELWSSRVQLLTTLEASSTHSLPTDPSGHSPLTTSPWGHRTPVSFVSVGLLCCEVPLQLSPCCCRTQGALSVSLLAA